MIMSNFSLMSNIMMKITSSISSGANAFVCAGTLEKIGLSILSLFLKLIYFICKWIMYFLDIIFFYIKQISGMTVDTSSLESLASGETDMVFKMLTVNSNLIVQIIRQLIGVGLIVIIVLTIIAVIKTQYDAFIKNSPASNSKAMMNLAKSLILIIVTPAIAIGGIMMSNIVLKSLYNATSVSGAPSLGSSIFSMASTSGNMYRLYAQQGDKVPIFFEFSQNEQYLDQIENEKELSLNGYKYLTSKDNPSYQTHLMFKDETFYKFEELKDENLNNQYYQNYDRPATQKDSENERIRSYREEYFVMADFIDYTVENSEVFYFKTIEEILDSAKTIPSSIYEDLISRYEIVVEDKLIHFSNDYYGYDELNMIPGGKYQIKYTHVRGALDELYGAVFIITKEKTVEIEGVTYTYYEPLVNGYRKDSSSNSFVSDYIKDGNMVVAKGLFDSDYLPTAIKRSKTSTDVIFYRDSLKKYNLGNIAGLVQIVPESEGGTNFFTSVLNIFKAIFNPESLIPKAYVNEDAVKVTYKKETGQVAALQNGRLHVSYMFNSSEPLKLGDLKISNMFTKADNVYDINLFNLFKLTKLNYIALVFGSWMLLKVCAMAVFALVKRFYNLFLLILFYPVTCATMPIDNGEGYKQWFNNFVKGLFSAYGMLLGINFVLMVAPLMRNFQFIKPEEIASVTTVRRVASIFGILSYSSLAWMFNKAIAFIFQLVAFSLLTGSSGIIKLMSTLVPGESDITTDNPLNDMANVVSSFGNVIKTGGKILGGATGLVALVMPGNKGKQARQKLKTRAIGMLPGNELVKSGLNKYTRVKNKIDQMKAGAKLLEGLSSNSVEGKEMETLLNNYLSSQKKYISSFDDNAWAAERDQKKKDAKANAQKEISNQKAGDGEDSENSAQREFDGYGDDELDKELTQSEKFLQKYEKKYKKGKLKGDKLKEYERVQKRNETINSVLEKRENRDKNMDDLNARINELSGKSNLSPEEQAELENAKKSMFDYQKQIEKEQKAYDLKHSRKARKNAEKQKKQEEKDRIMFRHTDIFARRKQRKRIDELQRELEDSEYDLRTSGISSDVYQGKSAADIQAELNDPTKTYSLEQREMLEQYKKKLEYRDGLVKKLDLEYTNKAQKKANTRINKDKNALTSGKLNPIAAATRGIRQRYVDRNIDSLQYELEEIEKELEAGTGVYDSKTLNERRKLQERRTKIRQKLLASEEWDRNSDPDRIDEMKEDRAYDKKVRKFAKKYDINNSAIAYLKKNKMPLTQENIDEYIRNVYGSYYAGKKRK